MKKIFLTLVALLLLVSCAKNEEPINNNDNNNEEPVIVEPEPEVYYSKLDGLVIENEEDNDRRIFAIMFDNDAKARPQSGLKYASIMYEIRVEGAGTRYLGIFQTDENLTLGPVRSARPYFVQTVAEYGDVVYGHHGGSPEGLSKISELGITNIDGMSYDGSVYQRQSHRYAPHNSYITLERFNQKADELGYSSTNNFSGFDFYETSTAIGGTPASEIELLYGYNTTDYIYQEDTHMYHRYKDGILHVDESDSEPLEVANIIIQFVESWFASNGVHRVMNNIGSGEGYYISHGEVIPISWSKESQSSRTYFTTEAGEPVTFNPGQTWIQWIEPNASITINE